MIDRHHSHPLLFVHRAPARRVTRVAVVLVALWFAGSALLADTVWLTNGRSLEGRAVVRSDGDVELHSTMGVVRVPGHKVDRVERSVSIEDRVASRLDDLRSVSADDLYELGMEARLEGAYTLSERLLGEALRLDPDHEATRRAMGFVRTADGWMLERLVAGRAPKRQKDESDAEAAERIALLRALRAQAEATRWTELQRQQLLALEAQRLAEAQNAPHTERDDFVVQTVIPIWSVPYGIPRGVSQPRTPQARSAPTPRQAARPGSPARRGAATQRTERRSTFVRHGGSNPR